MKCSRKRTSQPTNTSNFYHFLLHSFTPSFFFNPIPRKNSLTGYYIDNCLSKARNCSILSFFYRYALSYIIRENKCQGEAKSVHKMHKRVGEDDQLTRSRFLAENFPNSLLGQPYWRKLIKLGDDLLSK